MPAVTVATVSVLVVDDDDDVLMAIVSHMFFRIGLWVLLCHIYRCWTGGVPFFINSFMVGFATCLRSLFHCFCWAVFVTSRRFAV